MDDDMKPVALERQGTGSSDGRRVSFAEKAIVSNGSNEENDAVPVPTKTANSKRSTTAETFSDKSSVTSGDSGGIYEVIEYDPSLQVRSSMLSTGLDVMREEDEDYIGADLAIGENTPAAEALKASAAVRVSRVGKAARAVHIQAVRKLVKRATGTTKHGVVKGKPPRLPPQSPLQPGTSQIDDISEEPEDLTEEDEEEHINEAHINPTFHHPSRQTIARDHIPDDVVAGTAEAGKKVLGSVDPHDIVKVLRWRKKEKGHNDKVQKSYAKGKVIDGEHELYTLSIAVMIGVRTSISKTNLVLNSGPSKRWVLPQDYRTAEKYEFRPKGGVGMPAHQLAHTFKFKDYAPVVFAYLRRMAGINEFDFLISVCGNANFIEFISNAKSGQFFFYSSDGRYMIKTMTNVESKFLRRILPDYFRHCCDNPNTMVTKFFGMYRVKLYHLRRNVKFVIMNSVYYTDKYLQSFYDLKGSVIGRDAKPGQAVKKDNDLRRVLPHDALALNPATRVKVRRQLEKDTEFLESMGIMDYSMLVGVHHIPPATDRSIAFTGYCTSSNRKLSRKNVMDLEGDIAAADHDNTPKEHITTPQHSAEPLARGSQNEDTPLSARRNDDFGELLFLAGLDDDDSSYLKGSEKRPKEISRLPEDIEQKKQVTIEKLYWPFHQLFDIHGHRRLNPINCFTCNEAPCKCAPDESLTGYHVQRFVTPLTDRKDGGFEMDTTGLHLPMIYKGPTGDQLYEGKIFYMGIIDVLQEYNSRKMMEAQYRLFQASGKTEASCVDPQTYGQRFLKFFDEYTTRGNKGQLGSEGVEMTLALHASNSGLILKDDESLMTREAKRSAIDLTDPEHTPSSDPGADSVVDSTPKREPATAVSTPEPATAVSTPEPATAVSTPKTEPAAAKKQTIPDGHTKPTTKKSTSDLVVIEPAKRTPARKVPPRSAAVPAKKSEDALNIVSPTKKASDPSSEPKSFVKASQGEEAAASPRRLFGSRAKVS